MRNPLPVDLILDELSDALQSHGAAVLVAPPGSGKTTRVPPGLLQRGFAEAGQILMLEPRRVAARAAAGQLAREAQEPVGQTFGFHIRLERAAGPKTRVLVLTEGLLTRRLQDDPLLEGVSVVILDEFHERSLHADLALALLAEVRAEVRPDLKIVVMSATIDPVPLAHWLGDVPIIRSSGRAHPVEIAHQGGQGGRLEDEVRLALTTHWQEAGGDALVFLPGVGEIARCERALQKLARERGAVILPLHGELSSQEQDQALARGKGPRIVLATNVAETSVTVQGVRLVVDSGLVRRASQDPKRGLDRLELCRVSKASADQRAGRAGREFPGKAVRLWAAHQEISFDPYETPELLRADLMDTVLGLAAFGITDLLRFRWYEAPPERALLAAVKRLRVLGALAGDRLALTSIGRQIVQLGLGARAGRALIFAWAGGLPEAGARLAALLSERDLLSRENSADALPTGPSDVLLRLDLLESGGRLVPEGRRRRVLELARAIHARAKGVLGLPGAAPASEEVVLQQALLAAYPDRLARRKRAGALEAVLSEGRALKIAPESVVREAELFVVIDAGEVDRAEHAVARQLSAVEIEWLHEVGPGLSIQEEGGYDPEKDRVESLRVTRFGDFIIEQKGGGRLDPVAVEQALEAGIRSHRALVLSRLPPEVPVFLERVRWLKDIAPELGLPALNEDELIEFLVSMLPGLRRLSELYAAPLASWLQQRLSREQQRALHTEAPEFLELPNGRRARIRYEVGRPPILSARVQHLFGLTETPRLGGGRVACLVELLAPNQRPVQLTQDLQNFWRTTYAQVRKDLRGRYPKHDWPERPPGF